MAFSRSPNERRATKSLLKSRTVLCSIIGMAVSVAALFGFGTMSCEDQSELTELLLPLVTLVSSFGTFIFRVFATKMIG